MKFASDFKKMGLDAAQVYRTVEEHYLPAVELLTSPMLP